MGDALLPALVAALAAARPAEPVVPVSEVASILRATLGVALDPLVTSVMRLSLAVERFSPLHATIPEAMDAKLGRSMERREREAVLRAAASSTLTSEQDGEETPVSVGEQLTRASLEPPWEEKVGDGARGHSGATDEACPAGGEDQVGATGGHGGDSYQKAGAAQGDAATTGSAAAVERALEPAAVSTEERRAALAEEPWEASFDCIEHAWLAGRMVGDLHERDHFLRIRARLAQVERDDATFLANLDRLRTRMGDDFSYCLLESALQQLHHPSLSPLLLSTKMAALKRSGRRHVWRGPKT